MWKPDLRIGWKTRESKSAGFSMTTEYNSHKDLKAFHFYVSVSVRHPVVGTVFVIGSGFLTPGHTSLLTLRRQSSGFRKGSRDLF